MTIYVTDTAAAKSVSAYIILNKKGEHVATVRAHYSNSGICLVNVHDDKAGFQYARARGYGYDKFASALSGMTIDGHEMNDHCGTNDATKRMLNAYHVAMAVELIPVADQRVWEKKAAKIGARFANWRDGRYESLYLEAGLDKLRLFGYRVISAI